ncbi:single-stranded DNA-binding protein [Nonomuraea sp. ATR24]|uniref:single-stranded DNA-binding protein n=1 Tax=Nonomuraea sp. ATR24 TaxID=1676744 RepID=UPI0035BF96CF
MDRNEVLLAGRLSAGVEDRELPSGDTMTKWRLLVRRRRHRRHGTMTDSIPCVTFDTEVADLVRSLKPRDTLELTGAFRCRIFGPAQAKVWSYEVEVSSARVIEADPLPQEPPEPPPPTTPRPVAVLAETG